MNSKQNRKKASSGWASRSKVEGSWPNDPFSREESTEMPVGLRQVIWGTSLVVQCLRICLPMRGMQVQTLGGELRSHMRCGQLSPCATTTELVCSNPTCHNYSPQLEKSPHDTTKTQRSQKERKREKGVVWSKGSRSNLTPAYLLGIILQTKDHMCT